MPDLSTTYLGHRLKNPIVASASPLSEYIGNIRRLEDAGAAAIVLHSMFEEQITLESFELDRHLSKGAESFAEAVTYFPDLSEYKLGPDAYLEHIARARSAVEIPIIASLNGVSTGGWIQYAKDMQEAGANALELNVYYLPTDPNICGADVERMYIDLVMDVTNALEIPVAVKIGPYFSSIANMAHRLREAGADALVLFNRFYQPDLDIEHLEVTPNLKLSTPDELRLRLRWTAILYGKIDCDFAVTGGIHSATDVVKSVMAGANAAMMTSALLRNGIGHIETVRNDLDQWMEEHDYASIEEMRGSMSQRSVQESAAFERANYLRVLSSYTGKLTDIA